MKCIVSQSEFNSKQRQTVMIGENSVGSDQSAPEGCLKEQSDQGLHCLSFCLHFLHAIHHGKPHCLDIEITTANF